MLATRVIPTLLCRGRQLIKGQQFNGWRSCGLALQAARIHGMRGVDELVLLDIGATPEGRGPDLKLVEELSASMHTPLAVGGGIRTVEDVRNLLRAGADKVVVCSAIMADDGIKLLNAVADSFGRQAIVVAMDVRRNGPPYEDELYAQCGNRLVSTKNGLFPVGVLQAAKQIEAAGAGEIMLTSIDREGMMNGYDLEMIMAVSKAVNIPVIAHGGCGSYQHMLEAIQAGAHAVAAGALFQFTDCTPAGAAKFLRSAGIEVRVPTEEMA